MNEVLQMVLWGKGKRDKLYNSSGACLGLDATVWFVFVITELIAEAWMQSLTTDSSNEVLNMRLKEKAITEKLCNRSRHTVLNASLL